MLHMCLLQVVSALWAMVAVATCVSMNTGELCVHVLLDISFLPMEQSVKVCSMEKSI